MSDAREEAAIARDALVRDKKKPKQQTTLLTKWNIVLDRAGTERKLRSVVFATPPWKRAALSQPAPLAACTPKPPEERRKALEQKRTNPAGNRRTSQIHYTCMNYWMQMG